MVIDEIEIDKKSQSTVISSNIERDVESIYEKENKNGGIDDFKFIKKRILCELIKTESEECEKKEITEIANSLNPVLDIIINRNHAKVSHLQNFITYFVELHSDLVKTFPEYKDLKEDSTFRFIITAKNIYNFAFEVYFTLYDLYNVNIYQLHLD